MLKIQINKEVKNTTFPKGFKILRQEDGWLLITKENVPDQTVEVISIREEDFETFNYRDKYDSKAQKITLSSWEIEALSNNYII